MATKSGKRAAVKTVKKAKTTQAKPVGKATARPKKAAGDAKSGAAPKGRAATPSKAPTRRPVAPPPAPARASADPSLLERAERFRDAIHESKLSAIDPWTYNAKARGWARRAQALVDQIARSGDSAARRRQLEALTAEVEADPDYQEAYRRA